jgi:hypothetical protein
MGAAQAWEPHAAAAERGVVVRVDAVADLLGGALCAVRCGVPIIVLSPSLSPSDQRAALAHELIHLERGGGIDDLSLPSGWQHEVAREERRVDDEVARRLVPRSVLRDAERSGVTSAGELAAHLEVPSWVVERALELMAGDRGGRGAAAGGEEQLSGGTVR